MHILSSRKRWHVNLFVQLVVGVVLTSTCSTSFAIQNIWESEVPYTVSQGGVVDSTNWQLNGNSIFAVSDRAVSRIEPATGVVSWTREIGAGPMFRTMTDGGVVTFSIDGVPRVGTLNRFSAAGAKLWSINLAVSQNDLPELVPSDSSGDSVAMHVGDSAGTVVLIDGTGAQLWRRAIAFTPRQCKLGSTGVLACATLTTYRMFSRADGATMVERKYTGFESAYAFTMFTNADGSVTTGRDAVGLAAQRWSAAGTEERVFLPPTPYAKWAPRSDGGIFAHEFIAARTPTGGTARVASYSSSGALEWRTTYPEVSYYNELLATSDALYFQRYWSDLVKVSAGGVTSRHITAPFTLVNAAVVGQDLIYASGGSLIRRQLDDAVVWSAQAGALGDNSYGSNCPPPIYNSGPSVLAQRYLWPSPGQNLTLDSLARATGAVSSRTAPTVNDVNLQTTNPYSFAAAHCRGTIDAAGNALQVIVTRAQDGALSWILRTTSPGGAVLRETAATSIVASNSAIRLRDVEAVADGSAFVQVDDTLSKFDIAGTKLWTVPLPFSGYGDVAAVLLPDTAGGVFVTRAGYLKHFSAVGALLLDLPLANPIRTWFTDISGNLFVAYSGGYGDTLEKISALGQSLWASTLVLPGGANGRPRFSQLGALPDGGVFAAGCFATDQTRTTAMVVGFSNAGARLFFTPLPKALAALDTCTSSATLLSDQSIVVAVEQTYWAAFAGVHSSWNTGTFRLLPDGVVANSWIDWSRFNRRTNGGWSFVSIEAGDTIIQAGRFSQTASYFISVGARKWVVPTGGALSLVATIAAPTYQVGQVLPFRFTLRDALGNAQMATETKPVLVQPAEFEPRQGSGATLACTIPAGSSYCENTGLRSLKVGSGTVFYAYADGTAPAQTPAINITTAPATLMGRVLETPPFLAFSNVTVEFTLTTNNLSAGELLVVPDGYYGPYISITSGSNECVRRTDAGVLPAVFRCTVRLGSSTASISAFGEFASITGQSNNVTVAVMPVVTTNPTLKLEKLWPTNPAPLGSPVSAVVSLWGQSGKIAAQIPAGSITLTLNGQSCAATQIVVSTVLGPIYTGDYTCAITPQSVGRADLSALFTGGTALSAVPSTVLGSIDVQTVNGFFARHLISDSPGLGGRICSPTPGLQCEASPAGEQSFCVGPAGWQGSLYLRPATDVDFRLSSPPPLLGPLSGVSAATIQMPTLSTRAAYPQRCELDLNRDGYVDAERDALTLLRGMLGFAGSALSAGLTHPCVGRTDGAAIAALIAQQSLSGVNDVNGDSRVDAMSDGLVILRYLLGLRGSALTNGIAANAYSQRPTPEAMAVYLNGFCGLPP